MTEKYPAAPRLHERAELFIMAVGASVATGLLLVGVMALAPLAFLVRGGRSLLHGFQAKLALP
jgi:hypothetical protein